MAVALVTRGVPVPPERHSTFEALYGTDLGYSVQQQVHSSAVTRGAVEEVSLDGDDSNIVEIEDVDGLVTFHSVGALRREALNRGVTRADVTVEAARDTERGLVATVRHVTLSLPDQITAALEKLNRTLPEAVLGRVGRVVIDPAARAAMKQIVDWVDTPVGDDAPEANRRRRPKLPGVYRCDGKLLLESLQRLSARPTSEGDAPYLLLLHGTFSHTEAAFGALRGTEDWRRIVGQFEGRILALEHPTLGLTPAENALAAARLLPDGARLHVVSHSRGGLVGEALTYAASHAPVLRAYEALSQEHPDIVVLPELHRELTEHGIRVERFIRVACPARGTTLASRRVDRYLTYLFNVLRLVPGGGDTGVAELVQKLLLTLLDQRADPRIIPGLEAQMPESPFIRMLNTADAIDDGLASITGDVEGSGVVRRLMVLGADFFFREHNDLVVNTSAMDGGLPRRGGRKAFFHGGEVNHSSYFRNEPSRHALAAWLATPTTEVDVPPFVRTSRAAVIRQAVRSVGGAPPTGQSGTIILVPDLLGSTLTADGRRAWPEISEIAAVGVSRLLSLMPGDGATDLVPAYERLAELLGAPFAVRPFPYDARRSLRAAGADLAAHLSEMPAQSEGPFHIVAHGAGALVALAARAKAPEAWAQLIDGGGRVVFLSPPLTGTWIAAARLMGQDELTAALALVDGPMESDDVAALFSHHDGLLELLPDGAPLDPSLRQHAQDFRREVLTDTWDGVVAVYGSAKRTISGWLPDERRFEVTSLGDGHVPYAMALNRGLSTWYAAVPHSDLVVDEDTINDVLALLAGRRPARLLSFVPAVHDNREVLADPGTQLLFPTSDDLVRMAGGSGAAPVQRPSALHLSVVHGDLTALDIPIVIGSYDGTPMGGAEEAVDRLLHRALSRRRALGQYAGPVGTCELFRRQDEPRPAAAVMGMGDPGDVTPGRLAAGVTQSMLRLAAAHLEASPPPPTEQQPTPLSVASVLIGTSGVGAVTVQAAVQAIVTGVLRANRRLRDLHQPARVASLEIIELYEERAIEAVRAAVQLQGDTRSADEDLLIIEPLLQTGCGGRPGQPRPDYHTEQWRTVRIGATVGVDRRADGLVDLSFTSVGRSARAEQRVTTSQRVLIDRLVAQSIDKPQIDRQLYNTLYELLVPGSMKGQGHTSENLMYVLDDDAARLPLEMLATRSYDDGIVPLAVEIGVVRRLETSRFREGVRPATGTRALVIGDPPTTKYVRLQGAINEARRVAERLTSYGFEVVSLIPRDINDVDSVDVVSIMNKLFAHDYRIVHIAGHGVFDKNPARSGVVIGDDTFLTALEIQQMQTTPDLVFLNCCHLGAMQPAPGVEPAEESQRWRPDLLAASISRRLIDNGVRAVIAAGWAVNDQAAADFAGTFYDRLLDGDNLGGASLAARRLIFEMHMGSNTWGAYQVYGPPAFRLVPPKLRPKRDETPRSRREFREAIERIAGVAADAADDMVDDVANQLETLVSTAPAPWVSGDEYRAIGDVWRNLGRYRESVAAYESALAEWGASARLQAVEQLVNVLAKWAVAQDAQGYPEEANQLFTRAETLMKGLDGLGKQSTPERLSLWGSYYRRRMQIARAADLTRQLRAACQAYSDAARMYEEKLHAVDPYSTLNHVVLTWLEAARTGNGVGRPDDVSLVARCRQALQDTKCPDVWTRLGGPDADLAEHLLKGDLPDHQDKIAAEYEAAFAGGTSRRDRLAVIEHLTILIGGLPTRGKSARNVANVRTALVEIRRRLESWRPDLSPIRQ
jgi:tetratricopeptide (TPR) repeat protein